MNLTVSVRSGDNGGFGVDLHPDYEYTETIEVDVLCE
jgi:hypothetical protein